MPRKRPTWSPGRVVTLEHVSRVLKGNPLGDTHVRPLNVWLPPQYDQAKGRGRGARFPVVYDLVGFAGSGASHTNWRNFDENVPELVARLVHERKLGPLIVVFPDCFTSLGGNQYINSTAIGRYADYLTRELIPFVDREFRTLADRDHRGCFGKSSGGYGAMIHGMKYARYWGAVANHSGDAGFELVYGADWPNTLDQLAKYRRPKLAAGKRDVAAAAAAAGNSGVDDGRIARFLQHVWKKTGVNEAEWHALMNLAMAASYDPDPKAAERLSRAVQPRDRRAVAAALAPLAAPRPREPRRALRAAAAHAARHLHGLRLARPVSDSLRQPDVVPAPDSASRSTRVRGIRWHALRDRLSNEREPAVSVSRAEVTRPIDAV